MTFRFRSAIRAATLLALATTVPTMAALAQQSTAGVVNSFQVSELSDQTASDAAVVGLEEEVEIASVSDWPEGANEELPLAGIMYGNPYAGIGTANATIAYESSRRFRAERSGYVETVKYHNRILRDYEIDARCAQSGNNPANKYCVCKANKLDAFSCGYTMNSYHVGNGGTIVVELRPDDGNGYPGDEVLGKTVQFIPMNNQDKWYPELEFDVQPLLEAGRIYHLVFTNLTPPSNCAISNVPVDRARNCPRNEGAMSLNGNFHLSTPTSTSKYGPYRGNKSSATLFRRSPDRGWEQYWNSLSYYELRYVDGVAVGDTYYAHHAVSGGSTILGGQVRVRQRFTVRDDDRKVTGVWVNFGHVNSADGSPLNAELKNESGSVIASGLIPSSAYCRERALEGGSYARNNCRDWGYLDFGKTVLLSEEYTYTLELSTSSKGGYKISTYLPFTSHGFKDRNHWFGARAEYSRDNGARWNLWSGQWDFERDLPVVFTIEGMPLQLP